MTDVSRTVDHESREQLIEDVARATLVIYTNGYHPRQEATVEEIKRRFRATEAEERAKGAGA